MPRSQPWHDAKCSIKGPGLNTLGQAMGRRVGQLHRLSDQVFDGSENRGCARAAKSMPSKHGSTHGAAALGCLLILQKCSHLI